jgi:hypothetical protein
VNNVAVVILNLNGRAFFDECLASLSRLTVPVDIIVADNGSTDGSLAYLREHHPQVRLIDQQKNWGFAEGYNRALAEVPHPWVVLLNNDALLEPDWLECLLKVAEREPRAAILGGKLLFYRPEKTQRLMQCAGARFTDSGAAFEIGWGQVDAGQFDQPAPVGSIPGAAMLLKREVFADLGGFDPDYFAYLEDVDLCWRAWLRGYETLYVPEAVAWHHYASTGGGRASAFRIRLMQRNRYATMFKNLEAASLPGALIISVAYDYYRMLEFMAHGHWSGMRALAHGTFAFLSALPQILAQRAVIQRARQLSDHTLRSMRLLVPAWEAFQEYRRLGSLAMSWE